VKQNDGLDRLTTVAMAGAALMLAHQVAGKAARDGLFLSRFEATALPKMVLAAAVVAVLFGWLFGLLLKRYSPQRVVPGALLLSAALQAAEWILLDRSPDVVVVWVYLHIVGFGAILLSGFWSLANEVFDPREAKLRFGRIAGFGTAGGIVGGLLAERTVVWFGTASVLVLLAGLHLVAGLLVMGLSGPAAMPRTEATGSARAAFRRAPFLWSLAVLVLLGTTSAALLDYLFKSGATLEYGKGPGLVRFFALFYTGAQVLTFLVQTVVARFSLERLGLSRTVMSLPLAVGGGAAGALLLPVFPMVASVRALELILRGSLFRSGYELFYTPIPSQDKRAVKTLIDVGSDRMGDALGAGTLQLLLWLGPATARPQILAIAVGLAAISAWIASRMDKAYLQVLERGLISRAVELDLGDVQDSTTMSAVLQTTSVPVQTPAAKPTAPARAAVAAGLDPVVETLAELRSGDAERVLPALTRVEPVLVGQVIRLLAWDEVSPLAREALVHQGRGITGQLVDVLVDEGQDFAVRRRIPRILARMGGQRAMDGLMESLGDARFEVRFQCGRAMDYLRQKDGALHVEAARIYEVVGRELSVSKPIWEGHRLLDQRDVMDSYSFLDDVLRERANQSLEHVFSLLAVVLEREPLQVAFRALHSEDRLLRGLGLEYLEGVLPSGLGGRLTALVDEAPARGKGQSDEALLDRLMQSNQSLVLELRRKAG
jgi:AAA family ATP:ADP antiporter